MLPDLLILYKLGISELSRGCVQADWLKVLFFTSSDCSESKVLAQENLP